MKRREVLAIPLASAVPALAQTRRPRRIGYLHSVSIAPTNNALRIISTDWQHAGFVAGQNAFLRAGGGMPERLPGLVAELLAHDPGVLIAVGAPAVLAAARHGRGVPVVAADLETDPIEAGLAASEARPGGHVTGLFLHQPSIAAKWLDLLMEAAPRIRHVVFLWEPSTGMHQRQAAQTQAAARRLSFEVLNPFEVSDHAAAVGRLDHARTGVVMLTAPGYTDMLPRLSAALRDAGLPAIAFLANFVGHGLLLGYGPDQAHYYSRVMPIVERILAGEDPGSLPLERPTRYRFAVDLRVAAALGLHLPPPLLAQADEVIE
ncbi:ABC transporter substrate-binding protein [Falsiroseomonas sp.]|uniref:ABC transporter substrate-binding protein n=1 Tax=Falsiroseomonas sp. TaxID=2870721 RepID=UPI0035671680